MKITDKNSNSIMQFVKFSIVGATNALIGLLIYYMLIYFDVFYIISNAVSWIVSIFNAFYWNNKYVFKSSKGWMRTLLKTYITYGFSFLLSTILLWIFVEKMSITTTIAPLLTLLVTTPINFIINKCWTFK